MKTKKLICMVLTMILVIFTFAGCGENAKEKAVKEIENVKVSAYFEDEQDAVKELKEQYIKAVKEAKNDEEAEKQLKEFKKNLKKILTKEDKIKTYTKQLNEEIAKMDEKNKEKAQNIFDSYKDKLTEVKTNADFAKMIDEISAKIKEATKIEVEIEDDLTEPAAVASPNNSSAGSSSSKKSGSNSGSSSNKGSGSSSSSGGSSSSGSSKPSHQHSWTPHYATGYKTETYQYTVYYCSIHNMEFSSLGAADAHYCAMDDAGDPCGYKPVTRTGTKQVPYQYVDYYYCSCGATK